MAIYYRGMQGQRTWPAGEESLVAAIVEIARVDARQESTKKHEGHWPGEKKPGSGRGSEHSVHDCAVAFLAKIRERIEDEPTKPGGPDERMGLFAALYAMMTT